MFDVATAKEIPIDDTLFSNPWRISELRWWADSKQFTFLYNQRGHQVLRIVGVDTAGKARAVVDEVSKTFIDYAYKRFTHYMDETDEILWLSERDGWNHLYLYDSKTGKVKNQVTKGNWVVRRVERVDEDRRQVWFRASGVIPKQDPYYVHYGRVNFDGTGLVFLTQGDGTHELRFSPDRRFFIDTYSRVDSPPVTELRSSQRRQVHLPARACRLVRVVEDRLGDSGTIFRKRADGKTDIYGVIFRPTKIRRQTEVSRD